MTSETKKLRALFLSALMVVSIFGATAAFAGGAAAAANSAAISTTQPVQPGESVTVTYNTDNTNDYTVGIDADGDGTIQTDEMVNTVAGSTTSVTITPTDAAGIDSDTTDTFTVAVYESDGTSSFAVSDASTTTLQIDSTSPAVTAATAFNDASDEINPGTDADTDNVIELVFNDNLGDGTDGTAPVKGDFTVYLDDGTMVNPDSVVDGTTGDGQYLLDIGSTSIMQVDYVNVSTSPTGTDSAGNALALGNTSVTTTSKTITEGQYETTSQKAYAGEEVAIVANNIDDDLEIQTSAGELVLQGSTGQDSQVYVFDSADRNTSATYEFNFQGTTDSSLLDIRNLGLSASAVSADLTDEEDLEVDVEAVRGNENVEGAVYYATNDTQAGSTQTVTLDGSGEATINFGTQSAADYYVEVTDVQTGVTSTVENISVEAAADAELSFDQTLYEDERGDVTNISVSFAGPGQSATVYLGGDDVNFMQSVTVTDDSEDSEVILQFNSYDRTWDVVNEDDSVSSPTAEIAGSNTGKVLASAGYDLNATAGGDETDVASLNLQERSTTGLTTWVAPEGSQTSTATEIGSAATQQSSTAIDDKVIVQVEASGLEGLMESDFSAENLNSTTDATPNAETTGVYVTVDQIDSGANVDPKTQNVSNASLVKDLDNNNFYLVFDTSSSDYNFAEDEDYEATFVINESSPYVDDTTSAVDKEEFATTFSLNERSTTFSNLNETNYLNLEAADGVEVSGTSTAAPGTNISVTVKSSGNFLKQNPQVTVQEGGTWSTTFDLADQAVGTEYTVSATDATTRSGMIVEAEEEVTTTEPTTTEPTTTEPTTTEPTTTEPTTTEQTTEETTEPTTTPTETPGFGIAVAMLALIGAALIALRRRN